MSDSAHVYYENGQAVVEIAGREVNVERRDTENRGETCPIEFISVALGS